MVVEYSKIKKTVEKLSEEVSKFAVPKSPSDKVVEGTWSKPTLSDFTSKSWDELTSKEKNSISQHHGYSPKMPPDNFTDLKLPHHRPSDGAAVDNGIRNALARLPQTKGISADEKTRIKSHLNSHLNKLKKKEDTSKQSEEELAKETEEPETTPDDNMKDGVFTIPIIGDIGYEVTAEGINEQLAKAEGKDVVFEIASPGGSVYEGIEIFNAIRNYKGNTTAKIVGMAASMASYIPLATNKVLAEDNAVYMIHNAWTMAIGDSEALKAESEILESINETIAKAYVDKTGKSEKEVLDMMSDETWLFGDEIKAEGFVDEMIDHSKDEKKDKGANAKVDKVATLANAKVKVKDMFLKLQKDRMKEDLDKIKQKANGGLSKMSNKNYISKFAEKGVEDAKEVLMKLKELAKKDTITKDEVVKLAEELEAAITIKETVVTTEGVEDKDKATATEGDKDKDKLAEGEEDKDKADEDDKDKKEGKDKADEDDKDKSEGKDAESDKDKAKDKSAEDDKDKPDEDKDKPDESDKTAKQSEIAKAYQTVAKEAVTKLEELSKLYATEKDKNESLTNQNLKINEEISKFKEDAHKDLVNDVVDEISKFKDISEEKQTEKRDELSKMGDEALGIMKAEFKEMNISKMEEEQTETESSQELDGKDSSEKDPVSKMGDEDVEKAIKRTMNIKG